MHGGYLVILMFELLTLFPTVGLNIKNDFVKIVKSNCKKCLPFNSYAVFCLHYIDD